MSHLSESGGTFMEARLMWVRLKAELKNWRKVGREFLPLLGRHNRADKKKRKKETFK